MICRDLIVCVSNFHHGWQLPAGNNAHVGFCFSCEVWFFVVGLFWFH